ncbi:MAG: hypothetical protein AB7D27_14710 [Desulfomicrobium sp.]
MRKIVSLVVSMLLLASLALAGCAAMSTNTGGTSTISASQGMTQIAGVLKSLSTIISTSPLDDASKTKISSLLTTASEAVTAAAATTSGTMDLTSVTVALANIQGVVSDSTALSDSTRTQISNYVAWGNVALQAIGLISMVVGV